MTMTRSDCLHNICRTPQNCMISGNCVSRAVGDALKAQESTRKPAIGNFPGIFAQPQPVECAIPGGFCLRRVACKDRCREAIEKPSVLEDAARIINEAEKRNDELREKMTRVPFREIYPTDERELRTKALLDKAKLTPGERMELTMLLNHKWAKPERNC